MANGKILLVEDERDISENVAVRLEAQGYKVVCAYDGKMGVDMTISEKPDLVLLDVLLPKMNGFEVCKVLKGNPKTKGIPVLMLTSLISVGDVETAFNAGADDYLTKPFEYDRLLKKISKFLEKNE